MKLTNAKYLALLGVFCAVLPCIAEVTVWNITRWSGGDISLKNNRFTEALNSAKDGDVLLILNDITVNAPAELKLVPGQTSKKVTVLSTNSVPVNIFNNGETYGMTIATGTTLVMSNVTTAQSCPTQALHHFCLSPGLPLPSLLQEITRNKGLEEKTWERPIFPPQL